MNSNNIRIKSINDGVWGYWQEINFSKTLNIFLFKLFK